MPHLDTPGKTIGNRYHPNTIAAVNADAERLGVSQTIWMRCAVEIALDYEITQQEIDEFICTGRVDGAEWMKNPEVMGSDAAQRAAGCPQPKHDER